MDWRVRRLNLQECMYLPGTRTGHRLDCEQDGGESLHPVLKWT
jgi:hypothetical protein